MQLGRLERKIIDGYVKVVDGYPFHEGWIFTKRVSDGAEISHIGKTETVMLDWAKKNADLATATSRHAPLRPYTDAEIVEMSERLASGTFWT